MDFTKTPLSDCEVRNIIRFSTAENKSGAKIYWRLCDVNREEHFMNVWHVRGGRRCLKGGEQTRMTKNKKARQCNVYVLLDSGCHLTVTDLHREMPVHFTHEICHGTVKRGLKKLEMHKVYAQWVPRKMVPEMREQWVVALPTFLHRFFLTRYKKYGNELLVRVITGDEVWIHYWTPETKTSSSVWKMKDEPLPRKFKMEHSAGKVVSTVFWDCWGWIYAKFGTDALRWEQR